MFMPIASPVVQLKRRCTWRPAMEDEMCDSLPKRVVDSNTYGGVVVWDMWCVMVV